MCNRAHFVRVKYSRTRGELHERLIQKGVRSGSLLRQASAVVVWKSGCWG